LGYNPFQRQHSWGQQAEGVSFAILTANTFASLLDELMPANKKKVSAKAGPAKLATAQAKTAEGGAE